jgi:RNA polymerase sigma factor (sigma-70 family)
METGESADSLVSELQQDQLLREALSELTPRCRRLVQMLFFESPTRPYLQVAKDLKLAPGSIGFIRKRCLDKLRKRLEQMGFQ